MNQLLTVEVAEFVDAVDAALADLPADLRAELLEDLPSHLADVIADGDSPRDQLGEPAAYAAELRAAAGYPPAATGPSRRVQLADRLQTLDARAGTAIGYARFTDLLRALQPAWWVVRGYLATMVVTGAFSRYGADALIPRVGQSTPLGVVVAVVVCALSVLVGRRSRGGNAWVLVVSVLIAIGLAAFTVGMVARAIAPVTFTESTDEGGPLDSVTNIYPYGPDGKVLKNVRLYDQDGNPIALYLQCSDETAEPEVELFPRCPQDAVSTVPGQPIAPLATTSVPAPTQTSMPTVSSTPAPSR